MKPGLDQPPLRLPVWTLGRDQPATHHLPAKVRKKINKLMTQMRAKLKQAEAGGAKRKRTLKAAKKQAAKLSKLISTATRKNQIPPEMVDAITNNSTQATGAINALLATP